MPVTPKPVEATLPLPPEDEYGCRPEVSRAVLDEFLVQASLPGLISAESAIAMPELVATMREIASSECSGLALFSVLGSDLPGLVPQSLAGYPVWYVVLPAELASLAPRLPRASLGSYGGLTDDPWTNAVYVRLWTENDDTSVESNSGEPRRVAFLEGSADVGLAYRKGCVLVVVDCVGNLHLGGIPVGEDLLLDLQACESSSFQRPMRFYSVDYLQERTRAVSGR